MSLAVYVFIAASGLVLWGLLLAIRHRIRQLSLRVIRGPSGALRVTGHYPQIYNPSLGMEFLVNLLDYGRVARISGVLGDTKLVVSDPVACNTILVKEQDVFEETSWFLAVNNSVFGPGLLGTMGPRHRRQRKLLNPVFSIKHMRSMMSIFTNITHELRNVLKAKTADGPQEIDLMQWFSRLALELVAQGGMGYTFNSLDPHHDGNEFGRAIKEYLPTLGKVMVIRNVFPPVKRIVPAMIRTFIGRRIPWPALSHLMHQTDVMHGNTKVIFDEKKALLDLGDSEMVSQIGEGKDVISILLKANTAASAADRLPDDEILAQMSTLLFAGTDTTSSALARIFHLLSERQDVQERLRDELSAVPEAELGYDQLVNLPYLDAVCRETLRLYPPVPIITRTCRSHFSLPLSVPITTTYGELLSSIIIPKDTDVDINILGINRDPTIWGSDASEWKPERWLADLPGSVEAARIPGIYSNTLTFLGGGRACIGFKFSQLEMKVVLSQLIRAFRFRPSKNSEVIWRFGGILTPSARGSTAIGPTMPMLLERV
ncbi:cytochrome P450 [Auriscalpium vulgare]|uniref:Cytochrome P450 n=1 Tax=Auriscalpium vulgare TaxID=40419 RepID=A0ACB8RYS7_9AGAM|nr:cytochrome P450 [Auriscalpium vulgare]